MTDTEKFEMTLLESLIQEMAAVPWLFSKNPSVDFSRNRKLDFASTIKFILFMESGSIRKELMVLIWASFIIRKIQILITRRVQQEKAITQMVDLCQGQKKTIFTADRGYETYNIFAHIQIYQINHTIAIHICRYFLRNDIAPPAVEILIRKNLLPVRPERSDPRKVRRKTVVSFLYRVS